MPSSPITFGMCVEPGKLELQAIIFAKALRTLGGSYAETPVVMVSPRAKPFTASAAATLNELDCKLLVEDLNIDYRTYPLANKPFAAAWIAEQLGSPLWFFDCDTFVTSDLAPVAELLNEETDAILRCVWPGGFKDIGSYGPGDPKDAWWKAAYNLCDAIHEPYTWAPWAQRKIRGYWNSGVIISRDNALFTEWLRCFRLLKTSSLDLTRPAYLEQVAFAVAMATTGMRSKSLPGVNVALEQISRIPPHELHVVHYAGPGQKHIFALDKDNKLAFAHSGILDHPNGHTLLSLISDTLKLHNRAAVSVPFSKQHQRN